MIDRTAILALHYQNDVLHPDGRIRVGLSQDDPARIRVVDAAGRLLAAGRQHGVPIMHVRIAFRPDYADCPRNTAIFCQTVAIGAVRDGEWGAEFFQALAPQTSSDEFVFTHTRISAFAGTALEQTLRLLNRQRLIVAGVATHSVVENTVRQGADLGFDMVVAADACAAASDKTHQAALAAMSLVADITDVSGAVAGLAG